MSIILEKRDNIINTSNTAQDIFLGILSKINKRTLELDINESLNGNLDFSVLKDEGFIYVKSIRILKSGNITSIIGLPDKLEVFHCPSQLLINFDNIPKSLVELNLEKNYLEFIDISKLNNLRVLKLSNNKLSSLEGFSPSIEELYLNGNSIKKLDLQDLFQLRVLHISNNKSIVVKNLPPSVVDFKSENNPFVDIKYANMYDESATKDDTGEFDDMEDKITYMEALGNYFKLKTKYENVSYKNKKKIFQKENISKKEKKRLLAGYQPTCIQCKKVGGTVFEKKDNTYYAYCGNKSNPCNLKIEIYAGKYCSNHFAIATEHERINTITSKIIQEKLNTIFGYETDKDAVAKFKKQIEEFTFYNNDYKDCLERNTNLYKDAVKEELIKRKYIRIYEIVGAIKDLVEQYEKTNNKDLLKMAVELQIKELDPEIHNLRMLKYEIMEMISESKKEDDDEIPIASDSYEGTKKDSGKKKMPMYTLFQRYASLFKGEYNIGKPPKVIYYVTANK